MAIYSPRPLSAVEMFGKMSGGEKEMSSHFNLQTQHSQAPGGYRAQVTVYDDYSGATRVIWESEVFSDELDENGKVVTHSYAVADKAASEKVNSVLDALFA